MKTNYKYLIGFGILLLILWSSMETKTSYSSMTQLKLISKEINIDTINKDTHKRSQLKVVKTKTEPLLIAKIETSTKHINIQQTLQYYPKGDTISIPFVFYAKALKGKINESITIYGNFQQQQITIPITGYIK